MSESRQSSPPELPLGMGLFAGGTAANYGFAKVVARRARKSPDKVDSTEFVKNILTRDKRIALNRKEPVVHPSILDMIKFPGIGTENFAYVPSEQVIIAGRKADRTSLLHEIGHAKNYYYAERLLGKKGKKLLVGLSTLSPIAAFLVPPVVGYIRGPEESAAKTALVGLGLSTLLMSPRLADEALASIHAVRMGRRYKMPVRKRDLLGAFMTYALLPVSSAGLYALAAGWKKVLKGLEEY